MQKYFVSFFLKKQKLGFFRMLKLRERYKVLVIIMVGYNLKAIITVSLKRKLNQYPKSPTPKVTSKNAKHAKINHINILKNSLF